MTRGCGSRGVGECAGGAVATGCSPGIGFGRRSNILGGISHASREGQQGARVPQTGMVHCWLERKVVGKFKGDLVVASQDVVGGRIKIVEDLPGLVFNLRSTERSIECRLGLGG